MNRDDLSLIFEKALARASNLFGYELKPEIIHYENNFLNRRQKSECSRILGDQNYALLNLGIDSIAYLQPSREDFLRRAPLSKIAPV